MLQCIARTFYCTNTFHHSFQVHCCKLKKVCVKKPRNRSTGFCIDPLIISPFFHSHQHRHHHRHFHRHKHHHHNHIRSEIQKKIHMMWFVSDIHCHQPCRHMLMLRAWKKIYIVIIHQIICRQYHCTTILVPWPL